MDAVLVLLTLLFFRLILPFGLILLIGTWLQRPRTSY